MDTLCPIDQAAKDGNLNLLINLCQQGHELNEDIAISAAEKGHLNCLRYIHEFIPNRENSREWYNEAARFSAVNGHLHCLRYLHKVMMRLGESLNEDVISSAIRYGHVDCLRYLCESGCELYKHAAIDAIDHGRLTCLQYLVEKGAPYKLQEIIESLNEYTRYYRLDFDHHVWLRDFLFPHIDSESMPTRLNQICKQKITQIKLEKQTTESYLTDKISLAVVRHCLHLFI